MSRKTTTKSLAPRDSRRLRMRRITYDSATVNISVFIEQRNISFQNDISPKTMRLGVLPCEKLKHRETHGRIVSLDQLRLGVEEQLLIFSVSCLSPGRVKKLQKFINFCLKVGHSSNLKHLKSIWRQSCRDSCEMYKISTSRNGNDLRKLSFWFRALSCGADWFTKGVYKFAYRSAHNNLFLALRVIHKLKTNPTGFLPRCATGIHGITSFLSICS